jgi:hypothetical protein
VNDGCVQCVLPIPAFLVRVLFAVRDGGIRSLCCDEYVRSEEAVKQPPGRRMDMRLLGSLVLVGHGEQVLMLCGGACGQVMSVDMLEEQAVAYKQAVTEYRALAMAARASKTSKATSTNILDCLARRQVSNIFTQLRKVGS